MKGFAARVFTQHEQELLHGARCAGVCQLCRTFCRQGGFCKSCWHGAAGGRLTEIEVINDALGRPQLVLYGYFKDYAKGLGTEKIHLTLSHTKELAMAQVILEG